jgi:acetoin utilization deacetylase AcuC-like enzyme
LKTTSTSQLPHAPHGLRFFPVWSCENYPLELPQGHPFPNQKYPLLENLLRESGFAEHIRRCGTIDPLVLENVHTRAYIENVLSFSLSPEETRRVGFPVGQGYLNRALASVEGTLCATKEILFHGFTIAGVLAGGTHHAFADHGEGYCTFNDVAVCARYALNHSVNRVLVVDLDAHQGNGTASIFANEPRVFTFSMHAEENYPRQKERSTLDIGLPSGADDTHYLSLLKEHLPMIFDYFQPELVFFQSGVDVLAADRFGRLGLSMEGLEQRDTFVFESVLTRKIPCVITLGGGYQKDHAAVARAHAQTYLTAARKLHEHSSS